MTDQLAINENGQIIAQPMTWDGEPLYSPSTVREGLFAVEAFEQMPGQIALKEPERFGYWRYAHTVGRDSTSFHLVPEGADETLCGRPLGDFNCQLAAGYEDQVADHVCKRCAKHRDAR